jgi:3-carboxy-cis,cis-muconate cycloisomerase
MASHDNAVRGNVGILDSSIFGGIFGRGEMRNIMSDKAYMSGMIKAEAALARVEGRLGIIPLEAAEEIERACNPANIDIEQLRNDTVLVGLPVWGLTRLLTRLADASGSGKFLHWGLNTHDIMDLAQALQMKDGLSMIQRQIDTVRCLLVNLAIRYRTTIMVARTHLQHALPTTFGYRIAIWLSALDRHSARLIQILPRALMVQAGGASGSLASFGAAPEEGEADGFKVMKALAAELDLFESKIPWHAARDGLSETVCLLGLITGSLAKIALDVSFTLPCYFMAPIANYCFQIILMSTAEINEVAEPYVPHRGASSTMPQKANPVLCEAILASHKFTVQQVNLGMDALVVDFERAGMSAWHVEWAAIPQSFMHCSAALEHTTELLAGLRVFPDSMKRNLALSNGAVCAEHFVVAISAAMGRAKAHDLVYECCRDAMNRKLHLAEVLKTRLEIRALLSEEEIEWYAAPENYLGLTIQMLDGVLAGRVSKIIKIGGSSRVG